MKQFITVLGKENLGKEKIAFVTADREFSSGKWMAWLGEQGISFRLRLRADVLVQNSGGEMVCAHWLFRGCPLQQEQRLTGKRRCLGQSVFVCATRLPKTF